MRPSRRTDALPTDAPRAVAPILAALALALVAGCEADPSSYDRDLDGVPDFDDCAPDDPNTYPGAEETCDNLDNNCNSLVDEGLLQNWFVDEDGDGFGRQGGAQELCDPGEGYSQQAGDCDDKAPDVFPGAAELCDLVDNDCDEFIDEPLWSEDFEDPEDDPLLVYLRDATATVGPDDPNRFARLTPSEFEKSGALWRVEPFRGGKFTIEFLLDIWETGGFITGEGFTFVALPYASFEESPASLEEQVLGLIASEGRDLATYGIDRDGFAVEFDVRDSGPGEDGDTDTEGGGYHIAVHDVSSGDRLFEAPSPPSFTSTRSTFRQVLIAVEGERLRVELGDDLIFDRRISGLETADEMLVGFIGSTSDEYKSIIAVDDIYAGCPAVPPEPTRDDTGDTAETDAP